MALTETVVNLNYPGTEKTLTVELDKGITTTSEGDEVFLLKTSPGTGTTAAGGATISTVLVEHMRVGYVRSSGLAVPPFDITSSNKNLQVSFDGSAYYEITLSEGTGLTGEDVSDDLQTQINLLAAAGGAAEGNLAILNATVTWTKGKFLIMSGSSSNTFTGTSKSSVSVISGTSADARETLGFDIVHSSEVLAGKVVTETYITASATLGSANDSMLVESVANLSAGDAFSVTDGSDRDYFIATTISGNYLLTHSGSLSKEYAPGSLVQKVFERDPNGSLASPLQTVDDVIRHNIRVIAGQIDFS